MKQLFYLTLCIPVYLQGQITLYSSQFNNSSGWTLGSANNFDTWVVNNEYACSTPTPDQGGGSYLHILDDLGGEMCAYAGFYGMGSSGTCYASMNSGINTNGYSEVLIRFDWLCKGQTGMLPSYGTLEYSTDGSNWSRITNPVNQYSGQTSWKSVVVSSNAVPALLNQQNLRIRFGWVSSGYGTNPAFAIDNLSIEGKTAACDNAGGEIKPSVLSLCEGDSANLSLTGSVGSIQWQDSIPGGVWTTLAGGSNSYTSAALSESRFYRAKLSQTGCPDQYSALADVTINAMLHPAITLENLPLEFCAGSLFQLTAGMVHGGDQAKVFWMLGPEKIDSLSPTLIAEEAMNGLSVSAFLLSSEACISEDTVASEEALIQVHPLPEVGLELPEFWCQKNVVEPLSGGVPEGGVYSGAGVSDNTFDLSQNEGEYEIKYSYTDQHGCQASSADTVNISLCTTLNEAVGNKIQINPNPVNVNGSIRVTGWSASFQARILGMDGRQVHSKEYKAGQAIELNGLQQGVYLISVIGSGLIETRKILIQ